MADQIEVTKVVGAALVGAADESITITKVTGAVLMGTSRISVTKVSGAILIADKEKPIGHPVIYII